MGKRGPKSRPDEIKRLEGEPNKDRYHPNSIKVQTARPACPAFMCPEAKAEWRRIIPELERIGIISLIDRAALAGYCQSFGLWAQTQKALNAMAKADKKAGGDGNVLIIKSPGGGYMMNPLLKIADKALGRMHNYLTEFGMTPHSRLSMEITPPKPGEEEENDFDRLLREVAEEAESKKGSV